LYLAEVEAFNKAGFCIGGRFCGAYYAYYFVDVVRGYYEAFEYGGTFFGFAK